MPYETFSQPYAWLTWRLDQTETLARKQEVTGSLLCIRKHHTTFGNWLWSEVVSTEPPPDLCTPRSWQSENNSYSCSLVFRQKKYINPKRKLYEGVQTAQVLCMCIKHTLTIEEVLFHKNKPMPLSKFCVSGIKFSLIEFIYLVKFLGLENFIRYTVS